MNKKIIIGIVSLFVLALIGVGYHFLGSPADDRMVVTNAVERVSNSDLRFSFAYESGEHGLSSIDSTLGEIGSQGPLQMYLLMETQSLNDYYNMNDVGTEAPPSITILVFERPVGNEALEDSMTEVEKIKAWANSNSLSSIKLARSDIMETQVDSIQAISYNADGLYLQDIYIVKYGNLMYMFVGQYLKQGDYMHSSFHNLMKTVWFD